MHMRRMYIPIIMLITAVCFFMEVLLSSGVP